MFKVIRGRDRITDIEDLSLAQVRRVWKGLVWKQWKGEHKDFAWRVV